MARLDGRLVAATSVLPELRVTRNALLPAPPKPKEPGAKAAKPRNSGGETNRVSQDAVLNIKQGGDVVGV